jgi:predicted NUDIX family NTP pyrophosphohydrolase
MPPTVSAGILLYRTSGAAPEVLLVHPGGPMWARRDLGAWSLPKGEVDAGEQPLVAALREFAEETGSPAPAGEAAALGEVRLKSGKRVLAWALAGDLDADAVVSNTFEMQWPPRSDRTQTFPEVDRAQWFGFDDARERLNSAQAAFVDRLADILDLSTTS